MRGQRRLAGFRHEFYRCLTRRADELFELTDALLCTGGPVKSLVDLTLVPEHRRGHGALYDGLNNGRIEVDRLRCTLAGLVLPRAGDGRIVLAVDVSAWLRADAPTSAQRLFCHVYGRGKNQAQMIPGWPYSFVAALEPGRTSWTAVLDAVRLGPADDATAVTAEQLRALVGRLITARQWQPGDPDILIVCDAGYDVTRLAFVLADLPVQLLGRLRSDRVLRRPAPPRLPGTNGRPPKHGGEFALADPASWPEPQTTTITQTTRYGTATASSWNQLHPRLTRRTCWLDHDGQAQPGPGPSRVPQHPREDPLTGRCTKTRQARPRTTTRLQEPATSTPLRRRQNRETSPHHRSQAAANRLNNKLRDCWVTRWLRFVLCGLGSDVAVAGLLTGQAGGHQPDHGDLMKSSAWAMVRS